jgi:hypothetical protein
MGGAQRTGVQARFASGARRNVMEAPVLVAVVQLPPSPSLSRTPFLLACVRVRVRWWRAVLRADSGPVDNRKVEHKYVKRWVDARERSAATYFGWGCELHALRPMVHRRPP